MRSVSLARGDPGILVAATGESEAEVVNDLVACLAQELDLVPVLGLWPGLARFLDDARIPLDYNATERGPRGLVVGRKNHYGSSFQRETEVAALFARSSTSHTG